MANLRPWEQGETAASGASYACMGWLWQRADTDEKRVMQSTFKLVHLLFVLTVLGIAAVIFLPRLRQPDRAARYPVADAPVTAPASTNLSR